MDTNASDHHPWPEGRITGLDVPAGPVGDAARRLIQQLEPECPADRDELHVKATDVRPTDQVRMYVQVGGPGWWPRWLQVVRIEVSALWKEPTMVTVTGAALGHEEPASWPAEMNEIYQPHQDVRVRRLKASA